MNPLMDNLADNLRNVSIGHPASPLADVLVPQLKQALPGHNWSQTGEVLMSLGLQLASLNQAAADRSAEERCNLLIDTVLLAGQQLYADRPPPYPPSVQPIHVHAAAAQRKHRRWWIRALAALRVQWRSGREHP